jgi:release factor glutamine methyltransferase
VIVTNAIKEAVLILEKSKIASSHLDARLILAHLLKCDMQEIILNRHNDTLPTNLYQKFIEQIALRAKKIPVSHIINSREFYNNKFFVNNFVLDPRPDSECLIELIMSKYKIDSQINICELGCGSGCLIITLLKHYQNWKGLAIDVSPNALDVAIRNAQTILSDQRIKFLHSDMFKKIGDSKFDIIISNPPYIPTHEIANLQDEVRVHEPTIALDGGDDGLFFYREIARNSPPFLNESSKIFVEIGDGQFLAVKKIFAENNFDLLDYKTDLNNIIRTLEFKLIN